MIPWHGCFRGNEKLWIFWENNIQTKLIFLSFRNCSTCSFILAFHKSSSHVLHLTKFPSEHTSFWLSYNYSWFHPNWEVNRTCAAVGFKVLMHFQMGWNICFSKFQLGQKGVGTGPFIFLYHSSIFLYSVFLGIFLTLQLCKLFPLPSEEQLSNHLNNNLVSLLLRICHIKTWAFFFKTPSVLFIIATGHQMLSICLKWTFKRLNPLHIIQNFIHRTLKYYICG